MKPNISFINAFIRLVLGLTFFSFATAKLSRRPFCRKSKWVAFFSAKTIAEGMMRYCPFTALVNLKNNNDGGGDEAFQLMRDFITTVASSKKDEATETNIQKATDVNPS